MIIQMELKFAGCRWSRGIFFCFLFSFLVRCSAAFVAGVCVCAVHVHVSGDAWKMLKSGRKSNKKRSGRHWRPLTNRNTHSSWLPVVFHNLTKSVNAVFFFLIFFSFFVGQSYLVLVCARVLSALLFLELWFVWLDFHEAVYFIALIEEIQLLSVK